MWEYKNGNYNVKILDDGTKTRLSDNPIPEYPESIDVKITNKCNGGCVFCHENSTPKGKNFDVNFAYKLFKDLPGGIELAFGGGNPLECEQDLICLFRKLQKKRIICNITINALHLEDLCHSELLPTAVGISYRRELHDAIKRFECFQKVIHLIAGVHSIEDLRKCTNDFERVLILGYKKFGRGINFYSKNTETNLKKWKQEIGHFLNNNPKKLIIFDNLAIKQLDIKRFFSENRWRDIYMGEDGEFTMYLDLVEKKFAISSRSKKRYSIDNLSIKEMFEIIRISHKEHEKTI